MSMHFKFAYQICSNQILMAETNSRRSLKDNCKKKYVRTNHITLIPGTVKVSDMLNNVMCDENYGTFSKHILLSYFTAEMMNA